MFNSVTALLLPVKDIVILDGISDRLFENVKRQFAQVSCNHAYTALIYNCSCITRYFSSQNAAMPLCIRLHMFWSFHMGIVNN